jgi:hypothetical protein
MTHERFLTALVSVTAAFIVCVLWNSVGTVRVVETIEKNQLEERYTIPAKESTYWADYALVIKWTPSRDVHFERWTIKSVDGFECVLNSVNPESPPNVDVGCRYRAYWK